MIPAQSRAEVLCHALHIVDHPKQAEEHPVEVRALANYIKTFGPNADHPFVLFPKLYGRDVEAKFYCHSASIEAMLKEDGEDSEAVQEQMVINAPVYMVIISLDDGSYVGCPMESFGSHSFPMALTKEEIEKDYTPIDFYPGFVR